MSSPRVLFCTGDTPPRRGGVARYHGAVVDALGDACALYVPPQWWWPLLIPTVARAMRRHRVHELLVGEILPYGTIALVIHMLFGSPYRVICHGLDLRNASRILRKRWLARHILAGANAVIVNSAYTAELARALGALSEHITIIHPPIGIEPVGDEARAQSDHPVILSVGRLVARKGFDVLIRAMTRVRATAPNAELVIVGDGPERASLEALAGTERASVRFLHNVNDVELANAYASCNVFALLPRELPNGDVEGFGIVYLEAGAFGKPVVGTRSGGVPEAVRDWETGILVPPNNVNATADAIISLLNDPAYAQCMGERGRAWAQEHNQSAFASRIREQFGIIKQTSGPIISIIIPAYQNGHEVATCLDALARQPFQDFEVIIIDDGSDPPIELTSYILHSTARLLRQPHSGAPTARNYGAREAHGQFFFFCDADVVLKPDALERMLAALRAHPEASYTYGAFRFGWKKFSGFSFDADRLRRMPYIPTMSLVRRERFPGFDPTLKRFQDWDLWLTMLEQGHVGTFIPEVLYDVRNTKGTMSRWVPSFVHRLPWKTRRTRAYGAAMDIIRTKHHLPKV